MQTHTNNLYWYGSRWYDPELSRWAQPDPIVPGLGEDGNPNAIGYEDASTYSPLTVDYHEIQFLEELNQENWSRFQDPNFKLPSVPSNPNVFDRYSYSLNNPIRYVDPTGHDPIGWFIATVLTVITAPEIAVPALLCLAVALTIPDVREGVTTGLYEAGNAVSDVVSEANDRIAQTSLANKLPKKGNIPYIPPKQKGNPPYVRAPKGGFLDKYGNIWRRDKSKHGGEHWDVEHPDGSHTNVDDDGEISHGR